MKESFFLITLSDFKLGVCPSNFETDYTEMCWHILKLSRGKKSGIKLVHLKCTGKFCKRLRVGTSTRFLCSEMRA